MAGIPEAVSNSISSKQNVGLKVYSCGQTTLNRIPTWLAGAHSKPNCSYNCLIGMALKSSKRKCLPVNEIYTFFLNEFPYFRNSAPDGWKNSIRHSLSLGPYFRKTQVAGFQGKKGFQWEVIPDKLPALEQEIAKFLAEEKKLPHQFGIERLPPTSHYNSPDITRMRLTLPASQHHETAYCSEIKDSSSETLKLQCKKSEPSVLPKEAYLKDGAPQRKSAGLTTATNFVNKSHKDPTANNTNTMILRLPITTDHDKLSQVKITHSNSLLQQDLEKWLDLELVDDVITDGNENAEFGSRLIADGLGMKQSLTKANWSTHAYENEHCKSCTRKHVDTKSPQTECFTGCITDDWLEPASDWNQWNEPAYVERMINLSSSLQSYSLNKTTDDSEMAAEKPYRSKIHKCLSKINYVSKVGKKGVKYCNRKNPINDRKISTSNSAAAQKTSQSNVLMDKCCTYCTDKATCGTEWQVSDI